MKSTYLKAPFCFEQREVPIPQIGPDDVLIKIKACGFCGHELIQATYAAEDWLPFGHEFSGIIEKVGANVTNVAVGDKVVVETSIFNPYSDEARNGHPELDGLGNDIINYIGTRDTMGFAEYSSAPAALCVKFDKMSFEEGACIEPMGVAMDLFKTAGIELGDDVLVVGLGPIGLMALQMAKKAGARKVYAADLSTAGKRAELAKQFGADDVIFTDKQDITKYPFPRGGVNKALITAPPCTIEPTTHVMKLGGVIAFLGIAYGDAAMFTLDSNLVHHKKIQIRASDAVPALYFPLCIDLVESGMIDLKPLITQTFPLDKTVENLEYFVKNPATSVKAVMVAED
ncbi:MAG: alcohol dehydrogenase catalytic domain-containing protein [Christensenellaceae bacterium]|nr:alcohol dehydrogenase catalytic domain-containing protein [Christensenellaceae bacterium]